MGASSFTFTIEVPREVQWTTDAGLRTFSREDFYAHLWETFPGEIVGIHEGTLLSEEAFDAGLETESWTVDSAEAPRERDWVESQVSESAVLYFSDEPAAKRASKMIAKATGLSCGEPQEQKDEDWDAAWKASFQGVSVPPNWEILPPWREEPADTKSNVIRINPGAGFGTGTHETTQLCLQAVAFALRNAPVGTRVLDFGSGSGILSIAAARLGADVDGVEIDPLAIDNATENLALNSVADSREGLLKGKVTFALTFEELGTPDQKYSVVIANILRPVLIEFSELLVGRLARPGKIVLSGLIATDLPDVMTRYSSLLNGVKPQIFERGEWRALLFEVN
jgi:ribosomal protein L11 methyltransferase